MKTYLFIYAASVLLSLVLTELAIWLGRRLELTDGPNVRKLHRKPVPRIGGLAIYVSVMSVMGLVLLRMGAGGEVPDRTVAKMHSLVVAATIVFFLGLADDIRALRASLKLVVQFVAAALAYAGGIRIGAIAVGEWSPVELHQLAWPVTILWIVGITNAVNLSDGVDGLATTVSMIACGAIALLAFRSDQALMGVFMLAMLGALTGFLWFNFHPARIFLGDSGSLFLGFVIAVSSVLCFCRSHAFVDLALPAIALGIPLLDTLLSMVRRFVARRPVFAPDRGHFHHRLLQLGFGQEWTVGIVCGATLLVTGAGMLMSFVDALTSLILCGGIFMALLALFYVVGMFRVHRIIAGLKRRFHFGHQAREEIYRLCDLQLRFEQAKNSQAWWQAFCQAASHLEFAWALMTVTDHQGNMETHMWRRPGTSPTSARVTIIKVPTQIAAPRRSIEIEVAVLTNGSVEGAARRASLFGRLLDEYSMPAARGMAKPLTSTADRAPCRATRSLPTGRTRTAWLHSAANFAGGTNGPSGPGPS